jgi:ATP-dependent protease ClpP protease subunit
MPTNWHMKRKCRKQINDSEEETEDDEHLLRVIGSSVYFYCSVTKNNLLNLYEKLEEAAQNALKHKSPMQSPKVFLYIHSLGGDAFVGLSAMSHIRNSHVPIVTIADGFVASAASLILLASKERYILPNTQILIHQLRTVFWGKYEELLDEVNNSRLIMDSINSIYKQETTIPHRKIVELLKKEMNLSTDQCIRYGLVTGVLV